ncbi:MAG: Flp family type IVb pilin [Acidobacteriota bacterium]
MELFKNFWKEEEGQDLVEYALLLGFISLAVVTALTGVRTQLNTLYNSTATTLQSSAS